jgi:hypothetical protein
LLAHVELIRKIKSNGRRCEQRSRRRKVWWAKIMMRSFTSYSNDFENLSSILDSITTS